MVTQIDLSGFSVTSELELEPNDNKFAYGAAGPTSLDFQAANFQNAFPGEGAHTFTDSEMRSLHEMFTVWSSDGIDAVRTMDNFNRFYALYPELEMPGNLKTYVFITRPDLNIFSSIETGTLAEYIGTDGMTQRMLLENPEILFWLSKEYSSQHDFIPYLQGRTESLQIPDVQIRTSDFTIPFFSYKYSFPTVTNESETGGTFDITFREDEQMRITKLFNYWLMYMDAVNKNRYRPTRSHIYDHSYDYMCSVYEFICDPTSEWILFYSKYTGCVPVSVPTSNLSFSRGGSYDNKVGISFQYIRTETLRPAVITDFMMNVHRTGVDFMTLHDDDFDVTSPSLSACPAIVRTGPGTGNKLLLKWYPMDTAGTIKRHNRLLTPESVSRQKLVKTAEDILADNVTRNVRAHIAEKSPLAQHLKTDSSEIK